MYDEKGTTGTKVGNHCYILSLCRVTKQQLIQNGCRRTILTAVIRRVLGNKKNVVNLLQISRRGRLEETDSDDRAVTQADRQTVTTQLTRLNVAIQLNHTHAQMVVDNLAKWGSYLSYTVSSETSNLTWLISSFCRDLFSNEDVSHHQNKMHNKQKTLQFAANLGKQILLQRLHKSGNETRF